MENYKELGLTWKPWIGNNYERGGVFDRRILILGESHYGTENDNWFNENLTILSIQQKIGEAEGDPTFYKKAFHTNIFKAFNEKPDSNENKIEFWHSVAYFNYVQGSVGEKPRERPKKDKWNLSFSSVKKTLDLLKPEIIVVLGYTLWENIWEKFDFEIYEKTTFNKNHNVHRLKLEYSPLMFCIKHPSAGFSSDYFRPYVLNYINKK